MDAFAAAKKAQARERAARFLTAAPDKKALIDRVAPEKRARGDQFPYRKAVQRQGRVGSPTQVEGVAWEARVLRRAHQFSTQPDIFVAAAPRRPQIVSKPCFLAGKVRLTLAL
jgi:hypothetical protein